MDEKQILVKHHGRGQLHALDCTWVAGCNPSLGEYVVKARSAFPPDALEHSCLGASANRPEPSGRNRTAHDAFAKAVKARDGGRCVECGSAEGVVAHHVVPLMEGGDHDLANGVTLCRTCHRSKHTTYANKTHRSDGTPITRKKDPSDAL